MYRSGNWVGHGAAVLQKLEALETKLDSLEKYVKNVDTKVNDLSVKVEFLDSTTRKAMNSIDELDKGMTFLNSEVEHLKKLEKDCAAFRQVVLYMGVYQRRENLRFYGIEEDPEGAEDIQHVLVEFMQSELGIDDASVIEFQRVPLIPKLLNHDRSSRVFSAPRIVKGS